MTSEQPVSFLLVEDDISHAQLVMLEFDGHKNTTICHVLNGSEAMSYLRGEGTFLPDVIILDLKMPKKDGHDVISEVRNDAALKSIPIVVLTSSSDENDKKRAYELQINDYLVKPVKFTDFSRMIQDLIQYWSTANAQIREKIGKLSTKTENLRNVLDGEQS